MSKALSILVLGTCAASGCGRNVEVAASKDGNVAEVVELHVLDQVSGYPVSGAEVRLVDGSSFAEYSTTSQKLFETPEGLADPDRLSKWDAASKRLSIRAVTDAKGMAEVAGRYGKAGLSRGVVMVSAAGHASFQANLDSLVSAGPPQEPPVSLSIVVKIGRTATKE